MITAILKSLGEIAASPGWHMCRIAEAMEKPAISAAAHRFRVATYCLFLAMAFLFLASAILFVAGPANASEFLGWAAVVLMHACAFCGLRYERLNRLPDASHTPQQSGKC